MKIGEKLYGFSVISKEHLPEADGTLWLLEHEKLGTPLAFLERSDSNKSFYIAFKTPPTDDTGVFHIIEHSVLCGSEKFPVKEPFVELLKSSLKTFLNAMTYPDRTVYPVSSRSDKDFLNLIDVYMDAVFHPLMLTNENIFMQEGHRYELENKDAPLLINGVVYNEMKGAVSSPDEISSDELLKLLYPDSPFGKNSGGDPESICELSYQDFCAAHKKHYHPSGAFIFLDGEVDLSSVLPLLDSYLSEYERRDDIADVGADHGVCTEEKSVMFEISPDESTDSKLRAYLGVRTFDFDDTESAFMLSVIADAIAGTNESPLVRAFLDEGLCEDVSLFPIGQGIKFGSYAVELKNLNCSKDEAYECLDAAFKRIAEEGIGKDRLEASLNALEFKLREKDYGSLPRGLVFGLAMLDTWIYGGAAEDGLKYEHLLSSVRKKLEGDAFEEMLRDVFINNERKVKLTLIPSATLGREREAAEARRLEEIKSAMTDKEISDLLVRAEAFEKWQATPDTEEKLNTLPSLSVDDIPKEGVWTPTEVLSVDGREVLVHNIPTGGISYVELFFDISDLEYRELSLVSCITSLLGKCATEKYDADTLSQIKKSKLGSFSASSAVFVKDGTPTPYLYINASSLDSRRAELTDTVFEILNRTSFCDGKAIKNILIQKLIAMKEAFITSGHSAAVRRSRAYVSSAGALAEYLGGVEMYRSLKELLSDFDDSYEKIKADLTSLLAKIITKNRLTIAITANPCEDFVHSLVEIPEHLGSSPIPLSRSNLGLLNEGFVIPSRVSYIARSAALGDIGEKFSGSMHVLSNILSYTHLWNEIRVKGGAYGAGFSIRQSGDMSVYSYRDPNPSSSLRAADQSADFLRRFADNEDSIDSFIIGTFGDYDLLHSPRSAGAEATTLYMTGKTKIEEKKTRESMLETDNSELIRLANIVDDLMKNSGSCVFGSSDAINECMDVLKVKIEI